MQTRLQLIDTVKLKLVHKLFVRCCSIIEHFGLVSKGLQAVLEIGNTLGTLAESERIVSQIVCVHLKRLNRKSECGIEQTNLLREFVYFECDNSVVDVNLITKYKELLVAEEHIFCLS